MTAVPFERLLSMPAFEGLRILRVYGQRLPNEPMTSLVELISRVENDARSYDLHAALTLHDLIAKDTPCQGIEFYRVCLAEVLLTQLPEWVKLVTLGRGRFIKRLKASEFRDIRSLFREARLLDEPPSLEDVIWWDGIQTHVRSQVDFDKLQRARRAESLTMEFEAVRLAEIGILKLPIWMAIEDNTVGYDVLSYMPGDFGPLNRLIEVKSTIASPLRFYLTRNEWEQAIIFENNFVFHIWNLQCEPPKLFERTVADVQPHVPHDNEKGQWKTAVIPVGS